MLCSRFKQILLTKTSLDNNVQYRRFLSSRFAFKRYGIESIWSSLTEHRRHHQIMSSVRFIFKDLSINKLWSVWRRSVIVGHVVRRCRKDRSVREVFHCFRQTLLHPRRSLLLYATAACHAKDHDEKPGRPHSCSQGISDEDLEDLLEELDGIEELAQQTLHCKHCNKRIVLTNKFPDANYCPCKDALPPNGSPEGWEPYMEADDVIIWRREYKEGQGLYAYKVYGRYKDVRAKDFAAVNIDGAYRLKWDEAVAALAVVERDAYGVRGQCVLHWEVLWPRLFANRDYVYIRRHKEFTVKSAHSSHILDETIPKPHKAPPKPHKNPKTDESSECWEPPKPADDAHEIFKIPPKTPPKVTVIPPNMDLAPPKKAEPPKEVKESIQERPSVHDNAKQKSLEMYSKEPPPANKKSKNSEKVDKVYIIISRSCTHPDVPPSANAIRVSEYWSHMVIKTLHGEDQTGMEFVLTYYDEPAVGGLPGGVTAWATGRAAPAFLANMRLASKGYAEYKRGQKEETPDFTPSHEVKKVSHEEGDVAVNLKEEDMESSKTGPDMHNGLTKDESTQTDETHPPSEGKGTRDKGDRGDKLKVTDDKPKVTVDKGVNTGEKKPHKHIPTRPPPPKGDENSGELKEKESDTPEEENKPRAGWWYRPFMFFM